MSASDKFQKFTQIEHVLKRPDTYIGSIDTVSEEQWIIQDLKAIKKIVNYNPGLVQTAVELITNAVDHNFRCLSGNLEPVTKIECHIDDNSLTITNNGQGIPIEIHKEHKIYIPELIFSNLLTSSNYDDTQKRETAGRNGLGSKLTVIFSLEFTIELVTSGQKYVQTFKNNMSEKGKPVITKTKVKDYTKVIFKPDFKLFKMSSFKDNDTRLMIEKRIFDISAVTSKKLSVFLNDVKIDIKEFKDYIDIYIPEGAKKVLYEDEKWSIGFSLNPYDTSTAISFINGLYTCENGRHVDIIFEPVIKKVVEEIQNLAKVKKDNITIKPSYIRENLIVFVKCLAGNPKFNSQTKKKVESADFTKCVIPDDIISKISKLGFVDQLIEIARTKDLNNMKKATGSSTTIKRRIVIPKLDDAVNAGTKKSHLCKLIICEGDSAKSMIMSGISEVGNDYFGIFPIRGKMLNVKTATIKQLTENEEIININKILGLSYDMVDKSKLRYGGVIIFADNDEDSYHVNSLIINYFTHFWPKIVEDGFISKMITPLVKVKLNKKEIDFYNMYDFKEWKNNNNIGVYSQKRYKGLGTSSNSEAKQYFKDIAKNNIFYTYDPKIDEEKVLLAFDKKNADLRKKWISDAIVKIDRDGSSIDYTQKNVSVSSFIDNELVQFSIYDCKRSLPSAIDGLKPSQRKVLYGSIIKKIFTKKDETKVAQLGSFVAEKCHYFHGEVSLFETIIGMAQEFTGSGNAQIMFPSGQFGSRNLGGKDSANPRYIFSYLNKWIPIMFNEIDSKIIEYNYEDDDKIEPIKYVPVLPMILLNGALGIATGFSCNVPCFSPKDVIENIRALINDPDAPIKKMSPWYKYFKGTIIENGVNKWISRGIFERQTSKKVLVTELPIGLWYENFKDLLKKLEVDNILSYKDTPIQDPVNKQDYIHFLVTFENEQTDQAVIDLLKLEVGINATNMVAFTASGEIKKYESAEEILWNFYEIRLDMYHKRKAFMLSELDRRRHHISEKARFIKLIVTDKLVINKKKKSILVSELEKLKFSIIDELLALSISTLTEDRIDELNKEIENLSKEIELLRVKTAESLWLDDIDLLEKYLILI